MIPSLSTSRASYSAQVEEKKKEDEEARIVYSSSSSRRRRRLLLFLFFRLSKTQTMEKTTISSCVERTCSNSIMKSFLLIRYHEETEGRKVISPTPAQRERSSSSTREITLCSRTIVFASEVLIYDKLNDRSIVTARKHRSSLPDCSMGIMQTCEGRSVSPSRALPLSVVIAGATRKIDA